MLVLVRAVGGCGLAPAAASGDVRPLEMTPLVGLVLATSQPSAPLYKAAVEVWCSVTGSDRIRELPRGEALPIVSPF
jgi:hypothetical protein